MSDIMKQLAARKVERRRQLAALPVGEKLRMLEEMVAATKSITASQQPKPRNARHCTGVFAAGEFSHPAFLMPDAHQD